MFESTTDARVQAAIRNAHKERGKILGEVWAFLTRR